MFISNIYDSPIASICFYNPIALSLAKLGHGVGMVKRQITCLVINKLNTQPSHRINQ